MSRVFALVLAVVGGVFLTLAIQAEGGLSLTHLNKTAYYLTIAFIAFVKAALFASANYEEG